MNSLLIGHSHDPSIEPKSNPRSAPAPSKRDQAADFPKNSMPLLSRVKNILGCSEKNGAWSESPFPQPETGFPRLQRTLRLDPVFSPMLPDAGVYARIRRMVGASGDSAWPSSACEEPWGDAGSQKSDLRGFYFRWSGFSGSRSLGRNRPSLRTRLSSNQISPPPWASSCMHTMSQ